MASYLQQLLETLDEIPEFITNSFAKLRKMDEETHNYSKQIDTDGKQLLLDIKMYTKETEKECNIETIEERMKDIAARREILHNMVQKQQRLSQEIYDALDKCVNNFDKDNGKLKSMVAHSRPKESLDNTKRQKTERKDSTPASSLEFLVDPSAIEEENPLEPKYCTCRRVSSGMMVECENEDCPIEWFHFECVGLTKETQPEVWYCKACAANMKN